MTTFYEFLAFPVMGLNKRAWITHDDEKLAAYLRYPGRHLVNGKILETFDVATVEVLEQFRGQGVFTRFLGAVEAAGYPIYVENVMEKRFQTFFEERGYETVSKDMAGSKCFFSPNLRPTIKLSAQNVDDHLTILRTKS